MIESLTTSDVYVDPEDSLSELLSDLLSDTDTAGQPSEIAHLAKKYLAAVSPDHETSQKADEDNSGEPPDYLAEELVIAALLAKSVKDSAGTFVDDVMDVIENDINRLDDVLASAEARMGSNVSDSTEKKVMAAITREVRKGANASGLYSVIKDNPTTDDIIKGMTKAAKYYTNNYFNKFVLPELANKIDDFLLTGQADAAGYQAIREAMENRLATTNYWRVVGNSAASRSYHYGLLKAASSQGQTGYRFVAVLDRRTSYICRELDGEEYWIADAVNLMERVALADNPEEVKEITPWVSESEAKSLGIDRLAEMGVQVPPLHARCRSTIIPL